MKKFNHIIKAFRLKEQNPVLVSSMFGILDSSINTKTYGYQLLVYLSSILMISILCFFTNEYTDKDTDKFSLVKKPSLISKGQFILVFIIMSLVVLFFITYINKRIIPFIILMYLLGISYSMPNIRLKKYFPLDQISLMLVVVVIPYIIPFILCQQTINYLTLFFLIIYLGSTNLIAVSKDIYADKKAGLKNISAFLGYKGVMILGLISCITSLFLGFFIELKYDFYWYYFIYIFEMLLFYFFYKGYKLDFEIQKQMLISFTRRGISAGWVLVVILLLIILKKFIQIV